LKELLEYGNYMSDKIFMRRVMETIIVLEYGHVIRTLFGN